MRACLLALFLLSSCAGYRFTQTDNPLAQYGVESLSVPMFYNFSSLPEVASPFTRETYKLLNSFSGLKLRSGWRSADAVMIGIIRSQETVETTAMPSNPRNATEVAEQNVGPARGKFLIPGTTTVGLTLQIVVIKRPTSEELQLLQSELGPRIPPQSKIIFNVTFTVPGAFTREVFDGEAGSVVATQNAGTLRRTEEIMARSAAEQIRDMILYAF